MKKIPIGISDFKEIVSENYYFVDKSLFIKEIIDDGSKVILIPRPRRFGKTLNLSMLRYFFGKSECDNSYLFKDLKISEHKDIMELQGKYPIIYLTFKDEKYSTWEECKSGMKYLIKKEFRNHKYLLNTDTLDKNEQQEFESILNGTAENTLFLKSLKNLSEYLHRYHKQKTVILIDEYDIPIQSGYLNNYYNEVIEFMRNFLSGGLKDNEHIQKAVLTGILRVAKESIFSGLNNLEVCSILKQWHSDKFGFLENEVEEFLKYYDIEFEMDEVKKWYNGYVFGNNIIYNPWSIINFIKNWQEGFRAYWVNTSSNDLVKFILTKSGKDIKEELEALIGGEELQKFVNEDIVMDEINDSTENIWSFLLFSGYLKIVKKELREGYFFCNLAIPNLEVRRLYKQIVLSWFSENISSDKYNLMLKSLTSGDIKTFGKILKEFVINSVSYFDTGGVESEKVYHAFVLGMLISLEDYQVKSNRESGYGRYDVMVIPRDKTKKGIIFEFKKVDKDEDEDLEKAAKEALRQIKEKNYRQELIDAGAADIIELGVAFEGKNVLIRQG